MKAVEEAESKVWLARLHLRWSALALKPYGYSSAFGLHDYAPRPRTGWASVAPMAFRFSNRIYLL